MIDIRKILLAGRQELRRQHDEKNEGNTNYRIGSSGAICKDNQIRGVCLRIALLRQLKLEEQPSLGTQIMWAAGETNEMDWERVLTAAGVQFDMQRDIVWEIAPGVTVSGHPDVIIKDGDQEYGVELKGIFSYNTAASVYLDKRPKCSNVIQAMAYSAATGLPWMLAYTSPSYWKVPFYDKKRTDLKSLPPFYQLFTLEWRDDTVWYKHEDGEWVETLVTRQGIEDYYKMLAEMQQTKKLGPRPTAHYIDGTDEKWGGDACVFCPFASACTAYDGSRDYDAWLGMVKGIVDET